MSSPRKIGTRLRGIFALSVWVLLLVWYVLNWLSVSWVIAFRDRMSSPTGFIIEGIALLVLATYWFARARQAKRKYTSWATFPNMWHASLCGTLAVLWLLVGLLRLFEPPVETRENLKEETPNQQVHRTQ